MLLIPIRIKLQYVYNFTFTCNMNARQIYEDREGLCINKFESIYEVGKKGSAVL